MRIRYGGEVMAAAQYKEFLQKVIAEDRMWMLMRDGAVSVANIGRETCLPIWGSKETAEANLEDEWKEFDVKEVSVGAFFVLFLPDFINADVLIEMNVDVGFRKSVRAFEMDLRAEAKAQGFDIEASCREIAEEIEDMEAEEHYAELVNDIVSEGGIWTLFNKDDELMMADTDEESVIPMWNSYEEAADMCCDEWEECSPDFISVLSCLEELLPSLEEDEIRVLLITSEEMGGLTVSAEDLAKDLEEALAAECSDDCEAENVEESTGRKDNVIPFPKLQ